VTDETIRHLGRTFDVAMFGEVRPALRRTVKTGTPRMISRGTARWPLGIAGEAMAAAGAISSGKNQKELTMQRQPQAFRITGRH